MDHAHAQVCAAGVEPAERGPPARDVVGVPRAGMGRLLGLGPGRERRPDAMARDHRVSTLVAGSGKAGSPAAVELRPRDRRLPARRVRHLHRPERSRSVRAHIRHQRHRPMVPRVPLHLHGVLGGAVDVPIQPRRRRQPCACRFARRRLPAPEPAAAGRRGRGPVGHGAASGLRNAGHAAGRRRSVLRTSRRAALRCPPGPVGGLGR